MKIKWLIALLVNAILFFVFFKICTPAWDTNDDPVLSWISSGFMTGTPSPFLVQSHYALGLLLSTLFSITLHVNWYAGLYYLAHYIALTLLLFILLNKYSKWAALWLHVGFFVVCWCVMMLSLQFTSTAILLCSAGIFYFLFTFRKGLAWYHTAFSLLLVTVAIMMRWQIFAVCVVVFAPILLFEFLNDGTKKIPLFSVALVAVFAFTYGTHVLSYQQFGSPNFITSHSAGEVMSNEPGWPPLNDAALNKIGWKQSDIWIFKSWFWIDDTAHSKERVIQIGKYFSRTRTWKDTLTVLASTLRHSGQYPFMAFILMAVLFYFLSDRDRFILLFTIAAMLVLFFMVVMKSRMPPRVMYPTLGIPIFFALSHMAYDRFNTLSRGILVSTLLLLAVWSTYTLRIQNESNASGISKYDCLMKEMYAAKDKLIMIEPSAREFSAITYPVFMDLSANRGNNFLVLGWLIHSPAYNDFIRKNNLGNLTNSLITNPKVYQITNADNRWIQDFLEDHNHTKLKLNEYTTGCLTLGKYVPVANDTVK